MERKGENRLDRAAAVTAGALFGVILLFLGVVSLFMTNYFVSGETTGYHSDFPPLHLASLVAAVLLWGWLRPWLLKLDARWLFGGLMLVVAAVYSGMILAARTEPRHDQLAVLGVARQWAANNFADSEYLALYPNNIGLMLYFSLFSRLVGATDCILIQLANVFWLVVAHGCLAVLTHQLFKNPAVTRLTMLLGVAFYPLGLMAALVYGNLAGLALALFALVALCWYFHNGKLRYSLLAGMAIGGSVCLKQTGGIVLVAMVIYCLLDAWSAKRLKSLGVAAVVLVLGLGVNQVALALYAALAGLGAPPAGLPTLHWVVIGLSECYKAPGWWGHPFTAEVIGDFMAAGYRRAAIEPALQAELAARLKALGDPLYALRFFSEKALSMWNHPGFQTYKFRFEIPWYLAIKPYLNGWANLLQSMVLVASGCWLGLNFKKLKPMLLLPAVCFIGWFLFYLVWEAKALYACTYFVFLFPYAALGLDELAGRLPGWWAKLKGRLKKNGGVADEKAAT